ncbi:DHH family phosphoesterase [Bacillus paranthracis]|uniref:DHH family phosphoesterase n=1 Tax=Bacillus paranthracis TaxID=2026186 RepID=UPI0022E5A62C|nr:DHH family phosphoesterase [Bacillus paranthracis]
MTLFKAKLFTHTDLDGVGCAVVARHYFQKQLDVEYCSYGKINEKVKEFILSGEVKNYDVVFITDISVDKEVADLIEFEAATKFMLVDHHKTAEWLNEYDWASVTSVQPNYKENRNQITSGTNLFYETLISLFPKDEASNNTFLAEFVEHVRMYDSWEWKNVYGNMVAKQLNDLLQIVGLWDFEERFWKNPDIQFNHTEQRLLELEEKRINRHIKQKSKELKKMDIELEGNKYHVGLIFNESYHSETGNVICDENHDIDFVIMVNIGYGTMSLRRREDVDIDLGQVAKMFHESGGGHPPAAGTKVTDNQVNEIVHILTNPDLFKFLP